MFIRLLILFTVVPIVELALLIWIGGHIGVLPTVALVLLTGMAGATLARIEGWRTLREIQDQLRQGQMPGEALVQGAMILVAGAFLLTPGVLTDALGLCVLIPPLRRLLARELIRYFRLRFTIAHQDPEQLGPRKIVDARVRPVDRRGDDSD